MKNSNWNFQKYFFLIILLALIYLSFVIVKPFIPAIVGSILIVYLFNPVYNLLREKIGHQKFLAIALLFLVVLLFSLLTFYVITATFKEALALYDYFSVNAGSSGFFLNEYLPFFEQEAVNNFLTTTVKQTIPLLSSALSKLVTSIPLVIINIFVMFFLSYFLFLEKDNLLDHLLELAPFSKKNKQLLFNRVKRTLSALIYGHIFASFVQALILTLAFVFLGIKAPLLLGLLSFFLALLPFVGVPLVWIPVAAYLLIDGFAGDSSSLIIKGIIMVVVGILATYIDNIIKPFIVGARAKVHPVIILLGILGGLTAFGIIGVIVGPIILLLIVELAYIYEKEKTL